MTLLVNNYIAIKYFSLLFEEKSLKGSKQQIYKEIVRYETLKIINIGNRLKKSKFT